jgi:starch phosphorylase
MKLMMNGALTVGTLDGANVEMKDAVGAENIYIFGLGADDVANLRMAGYNSALYYAGNERLRSAVDRLGRGFSGEPFEDLKNYLLAGQGMADPYMCLADFDSYRLMHEKMYSDYLDRSGWSRKSLMNIAGSGFFAADRAVREYADRIWDLVPVGEDKRSHTANAPESAGTSGHSEG